MVLVHVVVLLEKLTAKLARIGERVTEAVACILEIWCQMAHVPGFTHAYVVQFTVIVTEETGCRRSGFRSIAHGGDLG